MKDRTAPPTARGLVDVFQPEAASSAGGPDTSAILASIGEVPYEWHIDSDALAWGANAPAVFKVRDAAAIATGRLYARVLDPANAATRFDAVMRDGRKDDGEGVAYQVEYCLRPADGADAKLWVEDTGRWFGGVDGKPVRAHGVVRVITERHAREEHLSYLSHFDELTGEMNRHHLTEMLGVALDEAVRYRASCGFFLVAIDNLARLNECYGFDVADEVIGAVSKRLHAKMRGGDSLGRFSGNKFGVLLKTCTPEDLEPAGERLLAAVRDDAVQTTVGTVAVTVTIGGVAAPRHARNVHEVLARAQESLEKAKARRQGSFLAYRPSVEREALRRENIRSTDEIVTALNDRRILLAFEPIVECVSRKPALYECLMRVRSAMGLVSASDIVPIAERLGLVRLLDHRVLELAMAELAAAPTLNASLNVSPESTTDPDWWSSLDALLRTHKGVAERLTIEITETAAIHDVDETRGFVVRAKDLGCRIAIDDFGAGATSFRNLRQLGVDIIKIDGAFVQKLTRSEDDRVFVRTMLDLGRALGLKTVAEWVQDEEAAAMLTEWGCDYLQGALIGLASVERPWAGGGQKPTRSAGAA